MGCDKQSYFTRAEAKKARKKINQLGTVRESLKTIYRCEWCHAYHLSSIEKTKSRKFKRLNLFKQKENSELEELRKQVSKNI
jgi:hypothetical protein